MEYAELNERYYSLFNEYLPFSSEEFEQVSNESELTKKEDLVRYYELRYNGPARPGNDRDDDFVSFLNALRIRDDEYVACLLILAKKHYLTFVFNADYSELIGVFPIKTWNVFVKLDEQV